MGLADPAAAQNLKKQNGQLVMVTLQNVKASARKQMTVMHLSGMRVVVTMQPNAILCLEHLKLKNATQKDRWMLPVTLNRIVSILCKHSSVRSHILKRIFYL